MNGIIEYENKVSEIKWFDFNNSIYGIDFRGARVFGLDDDNNCLKYKLRVYGDLNIDRAFGAVISDSSNLLFFVPFKNDSLCIYDLKNTTWKSIKINLKDNKKINDDGLFLNAVLFKEELFLIPFGYQEIIIINIKNGHQDVLELPKELLSKSYNMLFIKYAYLNERTILLPIVAGNKMLELDLNTRKMIVHNIPVKSLVFNSVLSCEGKIYIQCKNKPVILEIDNEFNLKEIINIENSTEKLNTCFTQTGFEAYGDYIYCFPARWKYAVKINIKTKKAYIINSLKRYCDNVSQNVRKFSDCIRKGDYIYLNCYNDILLKFNLKTEEIVEYKKKFRKNENKMLIDFLDSIAQS